MKNLLAILLAIFVCFSIVGCASYQNRAENSTEICEHSYTSSLYVDDVKIFYKEVSERMRESGFVVTAKYDTRGKLFTREFVSGGREYVVSAEITAIPTVYDFDVLVYIPYIDFSVKRLGRFGGKDVCMESKYPTYLFDLSVVGYIVDKAANLSKKKEPFVEIIDIPVGGGVIQ